MNGRQRRLPGWQIGALNGLVLGVLAEILLRAIYYYEGVRAGPVRTPEIIVDRIPYPFNWWYLPVLSLILVTVASVIGHRYLFPRLKPRVLRWPVIGLVAVAELYLFTLALDWWNAAHSAVPYWDYASSTNLFPWVLLIPAVILFNLLFGWLMTRFSLGREAQ